MPKWCMSSKSTVQLRLLLSTFFLLLTAGVGTVVHFFFETDAFVLFAFSAAAGYFFYAVMADANELSKHNSRTPIDRDK